MTPTPSNEVLAERHGTLRDAFDKETAATEEACSQLDARLKGVEQWLLVAKIFGSVLGVSAISALAWLLKLQTAASDAIEPINTAVVTATEVTIPNAVNKHVGQFLPIGTVVAWPGETVPDGWAICNGTLLSSDKAHLKDWDVKALQLALGYVRDDGSKNDTCAYKGPEQLPDYRGLFLRGVDDGKAGRLPAIRDPDRNKRMDHSGAVVSHEPHVGSIQGAATAAPINGSGIKSVTDSTFSSAGNGGRDTFRTHKWVTPNWGPETRPVNVYVHWIIKVR